jgi:hypothetical protein
MPGSWMVAVSAEAAHAAQCAEVVIEAAVSPA